MLKKISVTLAEGNPGEMECLANGATAIRYWQTFKADLLTGVSDLLSAIGIENLMKMQKTEKKAQETGGAKAQGEHEPTKEEMEIMIAIMSSRKLNIVSELAYVMNKQAEAKASNDANYASKMTIEDYIVWLEKWDSMSFLQGATEFINIYIGNKAGASTPKKEDAQLSAR